MRKKAGQFDASLELTTPLLLGRASFTVKTTKTQSRHEEIEKKKTNSIVMRSFPVVPWVTVHAYFFQDFVQLFRGQRGRVCHASYALSFQLTAVPVGDAEVSVCLLGLF